MLPAALAERQWWPRSKNSTSSGDNDLNNLSFPSEKSSAQGNSRKLSAGMKFSTLTNAMGFKSKKHQSIVQGPPSRRDASQTDNQTVRYTNRPPAKSVSSTLQSWDDPVEPQTPSQGSNRSRRSMLATPESDPFFSNGIHFQPVVHDPNRLSVYSGSSQSDSASKKNDMSFNRSSYTSSSAQSHHHGPDLSPTSSAISLNAGIDAKPISPTKRPKTRQTRSGLLSLPSSDENVVDLGDLDDVVHLSYPSLFKSGSSSTLTERKPPNESDPGWITSRPPRPRGMTDRGSTWSPQSIPAFLRSTSLPPKIPSLPSSPTSFNTPTHPRVIVRQPSASRVGPPTAPPSRNLPAPPSDTYRPGQEAEPPPGSPGISPTSVVAPNRELLLNQIATRSIDQEWDRVPINTKSSTGHTIRKAISHQSFSKRTSNLPSSSTIPDDVVGDRALRKQRSFHHTSRSILPPMPLWNLPPVPPQPQPALSIETSPNAEEYKGSPPTPSGRKRLFSGGSNKRPSSQIFSPGGDDQQPVFTSGPTQEDETSTSSLSGRSNSPALSARNEALSDPPLTSLDYTPQRIMSPLEMLRIEASWNEHLDQLEEHNASTPRERAHSFTSISTSMSRNMDYLQLPSTPKHYVVNPKSNLSGGANHSPGDPGTSSPRHTIRLSTSQTNMSRQGSPSPSPTQSSFLCSSPGLPPPPRPRLKSGNGERESSILSLSPRPLRRRDSKASTRSQPVRSIMKKPSFLVIDDEGQRQPIPVLSNFASSFLDLERGKDSFDTIRSEEG